MNKEIRKFISKGLIVSILFVNTSINSFAGTLSDDTRYETFEGKNIIVKDVLEENPVDIEITGNTIVNLLPPSYESWGGNITDNIRWSIYRRYNLIKPLKSNTTYTLISPKKPEKAEYLYFNYSVDNELIFETGYKQCDKLVFTTPTLPEGLQYECIPHMRSSSKSVGLELLDDSVECYLLEGDWSNKEVPDYFQGMKSVGQDDENGHKIEILSQNKNLFNKNSVNKLTKMWQGSKPTFDNAKGIISTDYYESIYWIKIKPSTTYTIQRLKTYRNRIGFSKEEPKLGVTTRAITDMSYDFPITVTSASDERYLLISGYCDNGYDSNITEQELLDSIQVEEGSSPSSYTIGSTNKKEIILKEPLRGLPNGTRDRIVKKDGKWYIERNCKYVSPEELSKAYWYVGNKNDEHETIIFNAGILNTKPSNGVVDTVICNVLVSKKDLWWVDEEGVHKYYNNTNLQIRIKKSKCNDVKLFPQWIIDNKVEVVLELAEPVYEPLYVNPTVNLYKEVSYISITDTKCQNIKTTVDRVVNRAKEYAELAKKNPTLYNISLARMWINLMRESILKDEFHDNIDTITEIEDMVLERKKASANLDLYIKSENLLSMSLNTNSISFDDFSGVEDMTKENAVTININSSLPYQLNSYLATDIQSSDKLNTMDKSILSIKENSKITYQKFSVINNKLILKSNCESGNNKQHNIDLKLNGSISHVKNVYKTTIKFEAEQI